MKTKFGSYAESIPSQTLTELDVRFLLFQDLRRAQMILSEILSQRIFRYSQLPNAFHSATYKLTFSAFALADVVSGRKGKLQCPTH